VVEVLLAFTVGGVTFDGVFLAACGTAIAAVLTAWAAVIRARKTGSKACEEELSQTRTQSENFQAELHKLRMAHPAVVSDE
jgi:hypothetical protein